MKQTLQNISTFLLGVLFCAMGLLILGALLTGCTPKIKIEAPTSLFPIHEQENTVSQDTVTWIPFQRLDGTTHFVSLDSILNGGKIVIDTLLIAGEAFEYHDTIPCPEGLTQDSIVYLTFTKILPSRKIPVSVTAMDTLYLNKPCPACPTLPRLPPEGSGWGERLAFIGTIAALLFGYWKQWRNRKPKVA